MRCVVFLLVPLMTTPTHPYLSDIAGEDIDPNVTISHWNAACMKVIVYNSNS